MEIQLKNWIIEFKRKQGIYPSKNQIKEKALELTDFKQSFKASKGWFEKFIARQFPELVDKTRKRQKKRFIMIPSAREAIKEKQLKHSLNTNSISTNNIVNSSEERTNKLRKLDVINEDFYDN